MNELKFLADFVTDVGQPHHSKKAMRYDKVISFLKQSNFPTDKVVAGFLKMKEDGASFRMFKSRLRRVLLLRLVSIKPAVSMRTPFGKANFSCGLDQYCVRLLLSIGSRPLARSIAKQALQRASLYQLTDFIAFFSRVLRTDSSVRGDMAAFSKYDGICRNALYTLIAEDQVNVFTEELNALHLTHTIWPMNLIEKGRTYCQTVSNLRQTYNTFNLNISYFRLHGQQRYIEQDYAGALGVWKEMEDYLNTSPHFDTSIRMGEALMNQLNCYIHTLAFGEANECIKKCRKIFSKQSVDWFTFMELSILLSMHSARYVAARKIYVEVAGHPRFMTLPQQQIERWEIFGAYISFLDAALKKDNEVMFQVGKARIKKLVENAVTQTKDKSGYNLSIHILNVLWCLAVKDYNEVLNKMDALRRYTTRYLSGKEYYRSNLFMRMLFAAEKADFDKKLTLKKTAGLRTQLAEATLLPKGKLIDGMEVIPYTTLWDLTVDLLKS